MPEARLARRRANYDGWSGWSHIKLDPATTVHLFVNGEPYIVNVTEQWIANEVERAAKIAAFQKSLNDASDE